MSSFLTVITASNKRVFQINQHYRQVLNSRIIDPAELAGQGNLTDAWFGGGSDSGTTAVSTVDRIIFQNDTVAAALRGSLQQSRAVLAAQGNQTDAWFAGGRTTAYVDRIIFQNDTATAIQKGPLQGAVRSLAAQGNQTDAWFGGGAPSAPANQTGKVDRIIFSNDTATAIQKGPLQLARYGLAASSNQTDAWFVGGGRTPTGSPPPPAVRLSTVDRIIFQNDTVTAIQKGPVQLERDFLAASGNQTDAWVAGGRTPATASTVDRIIFQTDTSTAIQKGPLQLARFYLAASGNQSDAWFGGGAQLPVVTTVDRIIFQNDTATAIQKGPLQTIREELAAQS